MKTRGEAYAAVYASAPWHPKFLSVPKDKRLAAFGFWSATLAWCQLHRTDGVLSGEQLEAVIPCRDDQREVIVPMLVSAGLFEATHDGIRVHDYLDWNKSAQEIQARREAQSAGGRKGGRRSGETRRSMTLKPNLQGSPEKSGEERAEEEASRVSDDPSCLQCGGTGSVDDKVCGWCGGSGLS